MAQGLSQGAPGSLRFRQGAALRQLPQAQAWGISGFRTRRLLAQDKGQQDCCAGFLKAIEAGGPHRCRCLSCLKFNAGF